jgi:DNA-binding transcriptional regulator YhcF (GntR family)
MPLDLSVSRDGDLPLGTQLAWQLKTLIATHRLAAGEQLPAARELGAAAGVNVNTVRSVYGRLEDEGFLRSQHGRGTFVADGPPAGDDLARIAAAASEQARTAGVDPRDLAVALFVAGGSARSPESETHDPPQDPPHDSSAPTADERARRRALRADIVRLEGELAYLEQLTSTPAGRARERAGRLLSAAELEAVRDELRERVTTLRAGRAALLAEQASAERAPQPAGRVWRHAGVSTHGVRPGTARVVWTAS